VAPGANDAKLEGTFDYSESGIGSLGGSLTLFSIFWLSFIGLATFILIDPGHRFNMHGSRWPFAWVLFPFTLIGIAVLVAGIRYRMAYANEKIEINGDEVQWTNASGVVCLSFTLNQVIDVQEKTLSQPSSSQMAPMHHRCIVQTPGGNMVFSDEIADYERLKAFFISKDHSPPKTGTFRYRSPDIFLVAAFVFPLTGALIYGFTTQYLTGAMMKMNGVWQQTPITAPLFAIGVSSVFYVLLGYGILSYLNERIVLSGDQLLYYNIFGSKKVDVPISRIEKGSFMRGPGASRGTLKYSVQTTQGKVAWSDAISNCTDLVEQLSAASQDSSLGETL
jgi:hypothetical protein